MTAISQMGKLRSRICFKVFREISGRASLRNQTLELHAISTGEIRRDSTYSSHFTDEKRRPGGFINFPSFF